MMRSFIPALSRVEEVFELFAKQESTMKISIDKKPKTYASAAVAVVVDVDLSTLFALVE